MANNRVYIRCNYCREEHYLAKYYPGADMGWYTTTDDLQGHLDEWLDKHTHLHSLFGYLNLDILPPEPFCLVYEAGGRDQDKILIAVSKAVSDANESDPAPEL